MVSTRQTKGQSLASKGGPSSVCPHADHCCTLTTNHPVTAGFHAPTLSLSRMQGVGEERDPELGDWLQILDAFT